jgi:hypothetical protein
MMLQPPPESEPVMVRIVEGPNGQLEQLADVLLGSIGLVGAITLMAVLVGGLVAGLMVWFRSRGGDDTTTVGPPWSQP